MITEVNFSEKIQRKRNVYPYNALYCGSYKQAKAN